MTAFVNVNKVYTKARPKELKGALDKDLGEM
jgi:hypothetical protein